MFMLKSLKKLRPSRKNEVSMGKLLIKLIFISVSCFVDLFSILLILNLFINLKSITIKIIMIISFIICFIGTLALLFYVKNSEPIIKKMIQILTIITIGIFFIGFSLTKYKIHLVDAERGSDIYDKISLPALIPLISGIMLFISGEIK